MEQSEKGRACEHTLSFSVAVLSAVLFWFALFFPFSLYCVPVVKGGLTVILSQGKGFLVPRPVTFPFQPFERVDIDPFWGAFVGPTSVRPYLHSPDSNLETWNLFRPDCRLPEDPVAKHFQSCDGKVIVILFDTNLPVAVCLKFQAMFPQTLVGRLVWDGRIYGSHKCVLVHSASVRLSWAFVLKA